MSDTAPRAQRVNVMRTIAMPANTNSNGDIFGGWIMSQMDIAGGIFAKDIAKSRVVTVAVDAMSFHLPVRVGDIVSWYASLVKIGNTSIKIHVEVWVQRDFHEQEFCVTEGMFTFVAIDEKGQPRKVFNPKTDDV
ncbi:MAG: acyl-CoA thioesterase [Pseudomonadota bacterium]